MKYCADTWFIIEAFDKSVEAINIIQEVRTGKGRIVIPIIVLAESTKKLMQKGVPSKLITQFFDGVEASDKVELITVDRTIAVESAHLSLSFNLPLIDSLVAATSKLTGCDVLLSGDEHYRLLVKKKYLRVRSW